MKKFPYTLMPERMRKPSIGLVVLQNDETIESEFRQYFPPEKYDLYVNRIPSGVRITPISLAAMGDNLVASVALFPPSIELDVVAYGCTSGTAVIGPPKVAQLIHQGCRCRHVTEPVSALAHICDKQNITSLGFLSPYIESVSQTLRDLLGDYGIDTGLFGSFDEAEEAKVARIDLKSILAAVNEFASGDVQAMFLSCTNLKTYELLQQPPAGVPLMSSNSVLAEHVSDLCRANRGATL